jgi:hypothetical protein
MHRSSSTLIDLGGAFCLSGNQHVGRFTPTPHARSVSDNEERYGVTARKSGRFTGA